MIRPLTCLCMLLAGGSGLYLYQEKHRTSLLDREITRTIHASEAAHERTGLLRAEWALLNEPGRLQDLADRFLSLHAMAPSQFVPAAELAQRLPPVAAPSGGSDEGDAAAVVAEARPAGPLAFDAVPARVEAARPATAHVAVAEAAHADPAPRPAPARALVATAEAKSVPVVPHPVRAVPVRSYAAASPAAGSTAGYSGGRVMAPVLSALATPVVAHPQRAEPLLTRAAAMMPMRPAYTPSALAAATPYAGSSLGSGRASLPPPVPMGAGAQ
ncbi:MAG: cell division protein FtsL [Janthinobacterium lividum]